MKEKEILKYLFVFFLIIFAFLVCEQLPTDVEVPNVSILSPKNSAGPYYGEVKIELKVSDNKGIEKIEIYIDNEIKSTLTSTPYIYIWDITESGKDGNFKLKVKAYDVSGNWKEAETNFKGHGKTTGEVFAYSFGDTISDRIPVLKWKKIPKAKYHLFVSDSSNFGTTVIFDSTVTDTSYQVIDPLALKTYYWKLRARFSKGPWSNWSQVRSFIIINYVEVTFKTTPSNLKVIVDSEEFKTPKVFKWNEGDIHDISSELIQPGSEDVQYEWLRWNVSNQRTFQYLVPDKDQTIEAELMTQYYLTTSENPDAGGDMTPSPPGGWFDIDTKVTVDATENAGYDWAGWSGALIDTIRPRNVTMDSPKSITANFGKEVQITIATNPTGLKIRVDGTEYKAPQPFTWIENSQHRLSVDSPQSTGQGKQYEYTSWSDGGDQTHNYTVPSASQRVTAKFDIIQYTLTMQVSGEGTTTPQEGPHVYDSGTIVDIFATPANLYSFENWTGDVANRNDSNTTVTMDSNKQVTANFIYDPEGPEIDLNVTEINFQKVYITGDFIIYNRGDKDLTWNISYKPSWIIDISPSDGSIQRNGSKLITVTASRNSLNEGIHSDNIEISNDDPDGNENPKSLNVEIEECAPEVSLVSPSDDQDYWEFTNFKIEFTANAIDDNNDNLSVNLYIKRYSSSSWDNYSMTKNGSYYKKSIQVTLGYRYQWYVKASDGNDEDSTSNRTIIVFERVMSEGFEEFSTHNNECEDNDGYWDVERWTADSDGGLYKEISEKIKSTMQDPDDFTWGQNNNHQEGNYSLHCASVELDGWPDSNDWFPDNNEYYPNTSSRDYRYEACDLEGNHAVNLSQYNGEIQLHFRILCNIESNPDYDRFRIVVRKNGISWQQLYLGSYSTSWKREFIDISNVGGYRLDPFRLEFRCNRIGQLTGVFIDDMSIWATRD